MAAVLDGVQQDLHSMQCIRLSQPCPKWTAGVSALQVAINNDINWVWSFYDVHRLFAQWNDILQRLYMSASALLAGWVSRAS